MGSGGLGYKEKKEQQSRIRKLRTSITNLETRLAEIESETAKLNDELLSEEVAADYKKTIEITERLAELEAEMEIKLNQWAEATEELENYQ